jgi:segregation and condensation protein B
MKKRKKQAAESPPDAPAETATESPDAPLADPIPAPLDNVAAESEGHADAEPIPEPVADQATEVVDGPPPGESFDSFEETTDVFVSADLLGDASDAALEASDEAPADATIDVAGAAAAEAPAGELPTDLPADADAALSGEAAAEPGADEQEPSPPVDSAARLESIIESLLFAADRPLGLGDLKRLLGERDAKKITAAIDGLKARHQDSGIQLASAGGGFQFRTHPENAPWVSKLIAGRPVRLSRAMLETLAIVAYRQPITRPEIDEIRGVDCGPVLKTLLDRALVRMIGKKEEVGRPILYGTTPEFLRTFSLKDLTELPTLRQFHELGAAEMAKVDAAAPARGAADAAAETATRAAPTAMPAPTELPDHDPAEEEALLAELDEATSAATRATKAPDEPPAAPPPDGGGSEPSE